MLESMKTGNLSPGEVFLECNYEIRKIAPKMTVGMVILETSFLWKKNLYSFLCFLGWRTSMY